MEINQLIHGHPRSALETFGARGPGQARNASSSREGLPLDRGIGSRRGDAEESGVVVSISEQAKAATTRGLSKEEEQEVRELRARDVEVRAHERAHQAAAGSHARGGPTYEYQRGPDGKQYASGGEVSIDTSPIAGDPDATIQKMQQVRRAALAPAEPSPQDRRVAAEASKMEATARAEKLEESREENDSGRSTKIQNAYSVSSEDRRGRSLDLIA